MAVFIVVIVFVKKDKVQNFLVYMSWANFFLTTTTSMTTTTTTIKMGFDTIEIDLVISIFKHAANILHHFWSILLIFLFSSLCNPNPSSFLDDIVQRMADGGLGPIQQKGQGPRTLLETVVGEQFFKNNFLLRMFCERETWSTPCYHSI